MRRPDQAPGNDPYVGTFPTPNCNDDDTYTLDAIPIKRFPGPVFQVIGLRRMTASPAQGPFARTPDEVMGAAKALYPGGARMSFGSGYYDIDITDASNVTAT